MKAVLLSAILALATCTARAAAGAQPTRAAPRGGSATSSPAVRAPTNAKESTELRQQARAALRERAFDRAEGLLAAGRRVRLQAEREAWQLFECELAIEREQPARAGLAAMRLVILSPDSPSVGAALHWSARAYELLDRPAKATELHRQCIEHATTPSNLKAQSRRRLDALSPPEGDGASRP